MPEDKKAIGKIAILHYSCPPIVGGVEAIMAAHARLFAETGYSVRLIAGRGATSRNQPGSGRISTAIEPLLDSKNESNLQLNRQLDRGEVPAGFEKAVEAIYQKLKNQLEGYDACIVHNVFTLHKNLALTTALARLATETAGPKFVAWCHDLAWADPLYAGVLYEGAPWNLLKTRLPGVSYVAISEKRRQQMIQLFAEEGGQTEIPVVPNGVALQDFLKLGRETRQILGTTGLDQANRQGALIVLLPARLTRRKNIELALRVVAEIKKRQPVRLIVTGPPGPHNPANDVYVRELLALRAELELTHEAIFLMESWQTATGKPKTVADETIADLYRYADALLFPSTQEGFGIPLLEAGLTHLPVFCNRLEPFEAVTGQLPYYFDPADAPASIARLMLDKLMTNPQHLLRRRVIENYCWESLFEKQIEPLVH